MEQKSGSNRRQIIVLVIMFIAAFVLWDTVVVYPVKLFVVILHEMSHGLMALLWGGSIIEIHIDSRVGGYCRFFYDGSTLGQFFIASAGYLGSLFWGGLILIVASKTRKDRYLTFLIGTAMLVLTYYVIQSGEMFGIVFCAAFGGCMLLSAKYAPDAFHDYLLKFMGLVSCLYVVIDIKSDLIDRSGLGSDADVIAGLTGIPSVGVGIAWSVLAVIMLYFFLKTALKGAN